MTELNIPKQIDLKAIPKDDIIEGIIINLEVKTWNDITKDETKRKNLKNPDGKVLFVKYEVDELIRENKFPFTEKPTTNSKYGRFIIKYGDFAIGQKIKIQFDSDGYTEIIVAK